MASWFQGIFSENKKSRRRYSKTKKPRHQDSKAKKTHHDIKIPRLIWPLIWENLPYSQDRYKLLPFMAAYTGRHGRQPCMKFEKFKCTAVRFLKGLPGMKFAKPKRKAVRFLAGLPCIEFEKPKCMAVRFRAGLPCMKIKKIKMHSSQIFRQKQPPEVFYIKGYS